MSIVRMQQRRGTQADWKNNETIILAVGEIGFETDTGLFKIGNGTTSWKDLDYFSRSLKDPQSTFIPSVGQVCLDTKSSADYVSIRIGDGVNQYQNLPSFYSANQLDGGAGSGFNTFASIKNKLVPAGGAVGQVLTRSGVDSYSLQWTNIPIQGIQDVAFDSAPTSGQYLRYQVSGGVGKWKNVSADRPTPQIYVQSSEPDSSTSQVGDVWLW